ncbi:hypothetical protein NAEGRDRAFT_62841 [Naegleria gruberi]|uniref:Meckelin n=1 Tax=Naegleria gruberi TaxID=5762 RepID=D2V212_NAEGR|nr:uncharacterized protein NAEGRDRAFT_62841 [Naegleria gruberi]EFC48821.1 hypothetical protein NAEGRDRAFT_62841 [Naegleria gruberi]|eukprot:XP_002681565.1 hypothetical protein NAEGRDRAFT_62841 [Naegleria gruberi strain NEG-M]
MFCKDCSTNEVSTDGLYCYCNEGYKLTFTTSSKTCEQCTFASSRDRSICMTCGPSTLGFDSTLKDCKCNGTSKLVEIDAGGNYLSAKQCISCGSKSIPHPSNRYLCSPCPDPLMQASTDGTSCVCPSSHQLWSNMCILKDAYLDINSKYPIDSSALITFIQVFENSRQDTPSTESVRSKLFYDYFYQAGAHCKSLQNVTACQMLANLCTLLLYDESTPACKMYYSIFNTLTEDRVNGFSGWKNGLPWLKYTGTASENLYNTDLLQSVGLSGRKDRVSRLQFYLSKFNVYGNWLGFEELTNQLELCPTSNFQGSGFLDFGNNYVKNCFYNVLSLPYSQSTFFYELYILDSGILYPVPVQILKDDKTSFADIGTSTLYRRFFLYDNLAGVTTDGTTPSVVRILESAQLYVSLNPSVSEKIYPPTLTLKYTSRKIQSSTLSKFVTSDTESITSPTISFSASYIQSQQTPWIIVLVFAIIGLVGSLLTSCIASYRYSRRRLAQIDFPTLGKFIFTFCAHFSNYLFIVIIVIVSLYYLFFKLQDSVFILLPNFDGADKWYFFVIVFVALLGKTLDLGYEFYKHCSYDIFFMDWEKSKGKVVGVGGRAEGSYSSVSIWRSYFIAKEWEKLQELTWTSLEFTLILVLLILDGGNVIQLASTSPLENKILTNYPSHPILRLALLMWFYLSISLLQYLFFKFVLYRFTRNPITSLIDTCSIANISIVILDELHSGCYIHGESIFRFADSNMKEFYEGLSLESNDFFPKRGLLQTSSEQKRNVVLTFDLYISRSVRENYDNFLLIPIQEEEAKNGFLRRAVGNQRGVSNQRPNMPQVNTFNNNNQFPPNPQNHETQQPNPTNPVTLNPPIEQPIQQTMRERNQINNPLLNSPLQGDFRISDIFNFNVGQKSRYIPAAFIDGYNTINEYFKRVVTDVKIKQGQILDKQLSYRLGFTPDFIYQHDREFFFKDDYEHFFQNYSFFRVMLRGTEWKMIFFNILLFAILNIFWESVFGILMIVYVINRGFLWLRRNFVRKNLISKTLLDRRFLF